MPNMLSYRETPAFGLSFELLVDGQPISALIGAWDPAIPYWLIAYDLPTLAAYDDDYSPEVRIVAVAACCGEYGCGHARCRVIAEGDTLLFCDFAGEGSGAGPSPTFCFTRRNYAAVLSAITQRAWEQRWQDTHPAQPKPE